MARPSLTQARDKTMSKLKFDWRIVKSARRGRWDIETRIFTRDAQGAWELAQNWTRHSVADSKRAALARIMILRERGERVTWSGGPIRLGVALVEADGLVT